MIAPVSVARSTIAARLEAVLRVPEHVGEHQPALGVGVDHLDGVALHRAHHVARALRLAVRHVLDEADEARRRWPAPCAARASSSRRRRPPAPPMSIVISSMPAAGLIEMPPVSKTTPLPTSANGRRVAAALPLHDDDLGRALRPLPDRQQRPHAERLELGLLEHLDLDAELAQAGQPLGELARGQHVGRLADEVAGEVDARPPAPRAARSAAAAAAGSRTWKRHRAVRRRRVLLRRPVRR